MSTRREAWKPAGSTSSRLISLSADPYGRRLILSDVVVKSSEYAPVHQQSVAILPDAWFFPFNGKEAPWHLSAVARSRIIFGYVRYAGVYMVEHVYPWLCVLRRGFDRLIALSAYRLRANDLALCKGSCTDLLHLLLLMMTEPVGVVGIAVIFSGAREPFFPQYSSGNLYAVVDEVQVPE